MWSSEDYVGEDKARQARLLAFFNRLSSNSKDLVLRVSEVIQQARQEDKKDDKKGKDNDGFKDE